MTNPLQQYFRQPVNYIRLPSGGQYYPDDAIDSLAGSDEHAVYAMTAKDEIMLKTPDALINGEAIIEIIRSCVPTIKNPWAMPSIDIDAVLIAIRMATYGDSYELDTVCPNCNESWRFAVDLRTFLDQTYNYRWQSEFNVGPLVISLWPLSYRQVTKNQTKILEEQRTLDFVNRSDISEEEKMAAFANSFKMLTELNLDIVAGCVHSITTPESVVTDQTQIREFLDNCDRQTFTAIREHIDSMKDQGQIKPLKLTCHSCEHEYDKSVSFDESFFSEPNS